MKNILLGLNVVLAACVGYLMYKQMGENKAASSTVTTKDSTGKTSAPSAVKIAYFEMDSLENNMAFLKDIRSEMEGRSNSAESELTNMKKRFQARAQQLQQKAQAQQMSAQEQESAGKEMQSMQQELAAKEASLTKGIQKESMDRMQSAHKEIEDFLKEYNKTHGYNYIFASSQGLFYYKDEAYNITKDVIDGVNKKYQKK
jgi:outer membrane protein